MRRISLSGGDSPSKHRQTLAPSAMKQLQAFLDETIFGYTKIGAFARDKIARCFQERTVMPKTRIITEGENL